jgi:PTS system ascorbate-specific IIA component
MARTMVPIVIVAHAPLASALLQVAGHIYADRCTHVTAVDVPAGADPEQAQALIAAALAEAAPQPALVLVDVFGATPSLAARAAAESHGARVVTGVNVPMLWRTLCYHDAPLDDLVGRAIAGGTSGVMQVSPTRRQNQTVSPQFHDQETDPHQQ